MSLTALVPWSGAALVRVSARARPTRPLSRCPRPPFQEKALHFFYLIMGIYKQMSKTDPQAKIDCADTFISIARRLTADVHVEPNLGICCRDGGTHGPAGDIR